MIDLITPYLPYAAWCFGGAIVGMGAMAALTVSKVADAGDAEDDAWAAGYDAGYKLGLRDDAHEMRAAHTRCSDALETARNRIERALAVETPKAAHGVKKMARLLRGEEA